MHTACHHLLQVAHRTITYPAAAVVLCQHVLEERSADPCLGMLKGLCPCMSKYTEAAIEKRSGHLLQITRCSKPLPV